MAEASIAAIVRLGCCSHFPSPLRMISCLAQNSTSFFCVSSSSGVTAAPFQPGETKNTSSWGASWFISARRASSPVRVRDSFTSSTSLFRFVPESIPKCHWFLSLLKRA